MRVDAIEVFSDAPNAAILRHPDRKFPGLLIQGDTLYRLHHSISTICAKIETNSPHAEDAGDLKIELETLLQHYKETLLRHGLPLPFPSS